jgi:hypothetical protein
MQCSNCGKTIDSAAPFCGYCGTAVAQTNHFLSGPVLLAIGLAFLAIAAVGGLVIITVLRARTPAFTVVAYATQTSQPTATPIQPSVAARRTIVALTAVVPTEPPPIVTPVPDAPVVIIVTATPPPSPTPLPTATSTPTPTSTVAPGIYVTSLRLEPPLPKRREDVAFYPMFLNTTGSEQRYRWMVYIYLADDLRHSFGETPKSTAPFPVGAVEQRANGTWKITGGGGGENFIARVAWINQDNQSIPFTKTDGQVYELPFTVSP